MENFTFSLFQGKGKTRFFFFYLFFILFLNCNVSFGQQVVGQFPSMDGGLENQTVGAPASTSSTTSWGCKGGTVVYSIANTSPRTGNKYIISNSAAATSKYIVSPSTTFTASTSYTIQFYYRTATATTTSASYVGTISNDGTSYTSSSPNISFTTAAPATWYKQIISITSNSTTPTSSGNAFLKTSGTTTNTAVDFDDIVVYAGTEDTTPPSDLASVSTSVASGTSLNLIWNGLLNAGDGGGYVIVRTTTGNSVTLNPNGIYAINNNSATGSGVIVGIVPGVAGTNTFLDSGLTSGTTYYYSIFAVDKAFNYSSNAATCSGTPISSTPFILSSPSALSYGYVKNNTSITQSFNLSAGTLSPISGNITVAAPSGYLVSTSSSGGFASSITVPYSSGTLASTPIYVKFTPTQSQSYTGNISLSGGGAATTSVSLTGTGSAYNNGSYKSIATGNWTATATWNKWDCATSTWGTSSDTPNLATSDVYIAGGFTVTVDASSKSCGNIEVSESSSLIASSIVKTPVYVKIYGNTVSVASGSRIGNSNTSDTADGISFDVFSNNLKVTGGGLINMCRIRTNTANTLLTIDTDVTLNYHGSGNAGNAAGFYIVAGDNNTLTINSGKTLTFAPWSCLLYTSGSHSTISNLSQTINLYGTMTFVDGEPTPAPTPYVPSGWTGHNNYFTMNVNGTATSTLNVYNGGTLNVSEFYPNGTNSNNTPGAGNAVTINVETGGKINVSKIADFRNSGQTVTGGGEFNLLAGATMKIGAVNGINASTASGPIQTTTRGFNVGSTYSYEGTSAQVTGDGLPSSVSGLTINNNSIGGVTLSSLVTVTGSLLASSGTLTTGSNNLTLGNSASATFSPSSVLSISGGTTDFNNRPVTLQSTVAGTARIGTITGTLTGATNVTVERYIPAKRAWRALTSPLKGSNASIFSQWQNNGTAVTGVGVELWHPSGDTTPSTNNSGLAVGPYSSILQYVAGNWSAVSNTNSTNLFTTSGNNAFMLFPTGGYGSGNIASNTTAAATILKATGQLITGDVSYSNLSDTNHTLIGNPYASPIDLNSILDANATLQKYFWVWDPNGANLGTYNTFDATANAYSVTNLSYTNSTVIQSGQAFFVKAATGQTGSFVISENNKSTASTPSVFRNNTPAELFRVGLYKQENNEWSGRDGAMTVILSDAAANQSPNKMANSTENIAFTKNGANFASNHHLPLVASDVLNVKVWNTTAGANYKLKLNTEEFSATNLEATLEDLFTNSRTPLTLDGSAVEYPFTVTTDALSTGDRFRIVFQTSALGMNNPKANGFSIVPNPVTGDSFQVNLGSLATGIYSYTICNAIGQEVEKGSIQNATQNTNYEVKMSNAATGIYIMKIKGSDNSVFTAKIIKK